MAVSQIVLHNFINQLAIEFANLVCQIALAVRMVKLVILAKQGKFAV